MGVRLTTLSCDECDTSWWEKFEQINRDEFLTFAQETTCPECNSGDWVLTVKSQFSGGRIQPNPPDKMGCRIRGFKCDDCSVEFHAWMPTMSSTDLDSLGCNLMCPDCESKEWQLTDTYEYIPGTEPIAPRYYKMVNTLD